ncbi:uncharacterized protein LOC122007222 [Zingiber officinale]|uniref:DUF7906 domain-containing protein n=1 Tax=Zingiber officinale TaxID=94328 RepID=A0A8J5FP37_ZINOF|nr:uncharacterized protein LOC122007222 [Zingiber officinale]KAG6491324.1 hypothetical protein ZIOFF_052662 [Zingiber officinale]
MYEAQVSISLFLVLTSITAAPVAGAAATALGLDTFLTSEYRRDPSASADSFAALPASLKRSIAATLPPSDHAALVSDLLSYRISVPVYVKLVGSFSSAAPDLLRSFAAAAVASDRYNVIGASPHHLAVGHTLHLDPSPSTLGSKISDAIRSQIESSTLPLYRSAFLSVPYSTVDQIIEQDFQKENSNSAPGFYIYLLNLGTQSKPYAYSVDSRDSSIAFTKCLGTLWTGKERYVWIDLAAGPVDYGPAISGEGVISRSEFHPLASGHGRPKSERNFLSDLTSLVLSAYKALLVPSLRIPVFYENSLVIQFIHVHGADPVKDGLDWSLIQQTLKESELAYKEQSLEFKSYSVRFSDCPICSFAISRSMSSYTSRFLFENYTLIVSEYLDSKRLHQILSDSVEELHRAVQIPEEDYGKVLPVYVFDLDYDKLLLLDRYHQSVAFRNMVIAVRTKSSQTVSDYSCNGRHVITQTRNLDRSVIGSVLQSMWGVSPTHQSWSSQHNTTMVDYTWSVGQTPFGPFSDSLSLSFAQRDAARRNVLLTALNYTITSAIDVLQSMAAHGGDRKLLKDNKHVAFVQRWNLLKYKLEKVISAISQFDFEKAMYFVRSSDHDLYAIHTLVYEASQKLEASLVCFKDPPFPWVSLSLFGVFLLGFSYVYAKKDKVFRSKRKQF